MSGRSAAQRFRFLKTAEPAELFLVGCASIFVVTTLVWTFLGSLLNMQNADQIVNPQLFDTVATFKSAELPGQHSFLLKWPLFFFVKLAGYSTSAYVAATLLSVGVTLGVLVFVLMRIERRQTMRGIILLALSSILLLTPVQPYPGGLLPVNMAMLTTRNIEYAFYFLGLFLLLRAPRIRSYTMLGGVFILALLFASDKLFQSMSLVAAFAALVIYAWRQYWSYATDATRWLLGGLAAAITASGILALVTAAHLGIISQTVTPYALAHGPKNLVLGTWYAALGILTNFGANPGHGAQTIAAFPHEVWRSLISGAGFAYLINFCLFVALAGLSAFFAFQHICRKNLEGGHSYSERFAVGLLWTAIASLPLFIVSDHQYVVDARYLTIWLFALLVAGCLQLRRVSLSRDAYPVIAALLFLSVLSGLWYSVHAYGASTAALSDTTERNARIVSIAHREHLNFLIGDYWRVLPIRQLSKSTLTVVPMQTCNQERNTLTSHEWDRARQHGKFAYLLTINGSVTDFPDCTFSAIENIYGTPDSSSLVAGTIEKPKELLLIYGSNKPTPKQVRVVANTSPVTTLPALPNAACSGPTIVNVVAHEDDDLLFMNPDTAKAIKQGFCVRTVYLTAGDAGIGRMYWLAREHGSREAYSLMIGKTDNWSLQEIAANAHESFTVATPMDNPRISLVFLRLPDGNLHGEGFGQNGGESLSGLYSHNLESLQSVDGQSSYSRAALTSMLAGILNAYQPTLVRTQSSPNSSSYEDHSDHQTSGKFATDAFNTYIKQSHQKSKIGYYIGYPVRDRKANLSQAEIAEKSATFLAYAKYDPSVCASVIICYQTPTYNAYLHRQYQASK